MMATVTARVPAEIRRQGNAVLEQLNATPTELIRAAYEYVLATGQMPVAKDGTGRDASELPDEKQRKLAEMIAETTFDVSPSLLDFDSYKQIRAQGLAEKYEALG